MVLLIITPTIVSALERLPESSREQLGLPAPQLNEPISHDQLITLSRKLSSCSFEDKGTSQTDAEDQTPSYTLNDLVRGTSVYIPPPAPKPEPTPEYVALMARLEAEAQARKYNTLLNPQSSNSQPSIFSSTSDTNSSSNVNALFDSDLDSDPLTPSLAINILVTVLFTGFATYWALSNFRIPSFFTFSTSRTENYPGSIESQPFRVFLSMFLALVVGVAEVVVYAAYWRKAEAAKAKERKVIEKKVVIGEYKGDIDGTDHDRSVPVGTTAEKVEIWGKGVNGGARRRLRERWKGGEEDSEFRPSRAIH